MEIYVVGSNLANVIQMSSHMFSWGKQVINFSGYPSNLELCNNILKYCKITHPSISLLPQLPKYFSHELSSHCPPFTYQISHGMSTFLVIAESRCTGLITDGQKEGLEKQMLLGASLSEPLVILGRTWINYSFQAG